MRQLITVLAAMAICLAAPALAQETRAVTAGQVPPPASIAEADWMVGDWVGERAAETWLAPFGGTMVGVFVLEKPDGSIQLTEHMYLTEEDGSLVLKLKHFSPELTAWEEKEEMARFPLIAIEHCAARFVGLTYRCEGEDGLMVAVQTEHEGEKAGEMVFHFKRRGALPAEACPDAISTLELNACFAARLDRALERQKHYLETALARVKERPELAAMIRASDTAFAAYRESECGAVWEDWKDGTIRTIESLGCSIALTDQRTNDIWRNWLQYMDSTPPVLPEPGPTH